LHGKRLSQTALQSRIPRSIPAVHFNLLSEARESASYEPVVARRLSEAAAWCDVHADPDRPLDSLRQLSDPGGFEDLNGDAVRTICEERASRIENLEPVDFSSLRGCLMAYYPDEQLADGAAEDETGGFFNIDNVPAWDTWVAFFFVPVPRAPQGWGPCLLSYVPEPFLRTVARGLYVNPESCIVWVRDMPEPLDLGLALPARNYPPEVTREDILGRR